MSKAFVIPDVHLKSKMFKRADELKKKGKYDEIVMLGGKENYRKLLELGQ